MKSYLPFPPSTLFAEQASLFWVSLLQFNLDHSTKKMITEERKTKCELRLCFTHS
jgi:hypothetical protein